MKKLILFIFLIAYSVMGYSDIEVKVEPSSLSLDENFKLTLTHNGSQGAGVPDLTVLQNNFMILGTERHVNYSVINGTASSSSEWIVTLRPIKSGIITIPPIHIGTEESKPLTVNITAATKPTSQDIDQSNQKDVFLTAQVDTKAPYINQQIIYTVKLYNSKRLLDANYQGPQVADALLIPLGDANRYQTVENNTNYVVEEQKYAIFPQKSGTIKIRSPKFSALVYDLNPQKITAHDKTISLNVKPIPSKITSSDWLPAQKIELSEEYENTSQTLSQGSTLTRTITITGVGVPAQLLPSLQFKDTDEFNVYPEKGTDHNQIQHGQLLGRTQIKITYLFKRSGPITIPEFKLPWFNTKTQTEEYSSLAPRSLNITPGASTNSQSNEKPLAESMKNEPKEPKTRADSNKLTGFTLNWGWISAIFFALAWIVTLVLLARRNYNPGTKHQSKTKALKELNKACSECNPQKARDALIRWANLQWPDADILNINDINKVSRDSHLKTQLNILSQVLYRSQNRMLWRGNELIHAVKGIKASQTQKIKRAERLPPINP